MVQFMKMLSLKSKRLNWFKMIISPDSLFTFLNKNVHFKKTNNPLKRVGLLNLQQHMKRFKRKNEK